MKCLTKLIINKIASHQQPLQRIWAIGLIEKWFCIWMIWQIRRMGLI